MRLGSAIFAREFLAGAVVGGLCLISTTTRGDLWSTGYYPGYRQDYLPPANLDFTAVSHIIHFSILPRSNGTCAAAYGITPSYSADLVSRAHAAGRKVLICAGGAGSQAGFLGATTPANRGALVCNLVEFMTKYDYDGIDLDWEPLDTSDIPQFTGLVHELRSALDEFTPPRLLTAATASLPFLFASLEKQFDQINLMTYDLAGPWAGWVTWFNASLFNGGYRFPSTGGLVPCTDGMVNNFVAAGVAPGKLGIGIAFYGYIWAGGNGTSTGGAALPRQTWTTAPALSPVAYFDIMSNYYQSNLYHWDTDAQAAYLSLDNQGTAADKFISYDDERACQAKVSFARNRHLGGVMIWELGQGYRATQPSGQRDPLLQSIKQALATPRLTGIQRSGLDVQLSFTSLPLAFYRVQWATDLTAGVWNTLTNYGPGAGGILQITDTGALVGQSQRFYRVQTPP